MERMGQLRLRLGSPLRAGSREELRALGLRLGVGGLVPLQLCPVLPGEEAAAGSGGAVT